MDVDSHTDFDTGSENICSQNFKSVVFLFFLLLFMHSTIMINHGLSRINGAVSCGEITNKGHVITAVIIILLFIGFDILVEHEWI